MFVTQKLSKKRKLSFIHVLRKTVFPHNIHFYLTVASKLFSVMIPMTVFGLNRIMKVLLIYSYIITFVIFLTPF